MHTTSGQEMLFLARSAAHDEDTRLASGAFEEAEEPLEDAHRSEHSSLGGRAGKHTRSLPLLSLRSPNRHATPSEAWSSHLSV